MNVPHGISWHGKAWISPGVGIFLGRAGSHNWHRHMAHQITIGLTRDLTVTTVDSSVTARAICIQAGTTHRIEAVEVMSIYLDALSAEALALHPRAGVAPTEVQDVSPIRTLLETSGLTAQQVRQMVRQVLNLSSIPAIDPRLQSILSAVRESVHSRDELAKLVHLSPTRFSHWFVEQTGLPLRSYRKWARLVNAIQEIALWLSLTEAAHAAGFADAAHFSRTFRSLFGLDPSSALGQISLSS